MSIILRLRRLVVCGLAFFTSAALGDNSVKKGSMTDIGGGAPFRPDLMTTKRSAVKSPPVETMILKTSASFLAFSDIGVARYEPYGIAREKLIKAGWQPVSLLSLQPAESTQSQWGEVKWRRGNPLGEAYFDNAQKERLTVPLNHYQDKGLVIGSFGGQKVRVAPAKP
jgi:hypothetical protein